MSEVKSNRAWRLECAALRAELAECRKVAERMRTVGTRLSNVAFNLAQRCGHTIDSDDVSILDGLRKQWDALTIRQVDRL